MNPAYYAIAADIVLTLHVGVATFVVGGLVMIVLGNTTRWVSMRWVNSMLFRISHLAAIFVVVAAAWAGRVCPLTTLEMWLREQAGEATYTGSFIAHWMGKLLYFNAPLWVFALIYSLFAVCVVATWFIYPINKKPRS